ncbi:hypothetical protein ACP70R_019277 [Stipagrostis hirtigluma subsp. patula]
MAGSGPAPTLLLALLAVVIAAAAAASEPPGSGSVCDTAKCGKGKCSETPGLIPGAVSYKCECDSGWSKAIDLFPFAPCILPICSYSSACFNLTVPPPTGIPATDPCVAVNCGRGGGCKEGGAGGFSYRCECQPGFANLLNDTSLPCIGGDCKFGADCAKLGLSPGPSAAAPTPAGSGLHQY